MYSLLCSRETITMNTETVEEVIIFEWAVRNCGPESSDEVEWDKCDTKN